MNKIYAILDKKAQALTGGLQLHRHEAAAVRVFSDIASDPQTTIARHPEDFELLCLGLLNDEDVYDEKNGVTPIRSAYTITATTRPTVVITGAAWKAAQKQEETK